MRVLIFLIIFAFVCFGFSVNSKAQIKNPSGLTNNAKTSQKNRHLEKLGGPGVLGPYDSSKNPPKVFRNPYVKDEEKKSSVTYGNNKYEDILSPQFGGTITIERDHIFIGDGISKPLVLANIRANMIHMELCYMKMLEAKVNPNGTFFVGFDIASSGKVKSLQIKKDAPENEPLGNCLTEKINTWTFIRPDSGKVVKVSLEIVFSFQ